MLGVQHCVCPPMAEAEGYGIFAADGTQNGPGEA